MRGGRARKAGGMTSHKTMLGLAAAAAVLVPATAAHAAGTLSHQGGALHWTAVDAAQIVMLDGDYGSKVRFAKRSGQVIPTTRPERS